MIDSYTLVKTVHVSTVVFTGFYFVLRSLSQFAGLDWFRRRWARRISQYNDTLLLLAGLTLAGLLGQYPFAQAWLTAKLLLVVIYILLGMLVLYWLPRQWQRLLAWLGALLVYGYIIGIAINKTPLWLMNLID